MALPFLNGVTGKKRSQMMVVDLGGRTTKAVILERRGEVLALTSFALIDAPIYERRISSELLTEHLRAVTQALGSQTKVVTLASAWMTRWCDRWSCRRSRWMKCGWS